MERRVGALLLVLACSSAAAIPISAAALTISDATFPEAPWSASELLDSSGAATSSASQQLAGGFPDAFRQTTHSIPAAGQSIIVGHVFSGARYDPSGEGAIASIDFSLDLRFIGGSVGTAQVGYQLILVQGGTHYNGLATAAAVAQGPGNGLPGAWSSHSFGGLTASSFTRLFGGGPSSPDFSAGGGEIQFGYLTQNTSIDTGIATTSGIDNWSVVVHPVPERPAIALVGTALLGLVFAGRRGRGRLVRWPEAWKIPDMPGTSDMPGTFRRCSSCKQDIALGAKYWVCSVSTCNRNRTALAFCTTDCWDAHLGFVNHRESWAEERRAPLTPGAPSAPPRPAAVRPAAVEDRTPKRTLVSPLPAIASRPAPPLAAAPEREILIITSRLKAYIYERSDMNTSDRVLEVLSDEVRRLADRAIAEARRNERKTVLDRDFAAVLGAQRTSR